MSAADTTSPSTSSPASPTGSPRPLGLRKSSSRRKKKGDLFPSIRKSKSSPLGPGEASAESGWTGSPTNASFRSGVHSPSLASPGRQGSMAFLSEERLTPAPTAVPKQNISFQSKVSQRLFKSYVLPKAEHSAYKYASKEEGAVIDLLMEVSGDSSRTVLSLPNVTFSEDTMVLLVSVVSSHLSLQEIDLSNSTLAESFVPKLIDSIHKAPALHTVNLNDTSPISPTQANKVADMLRERQHQKQKSALVRKESKRKQKEEEKSGKLKKVHAVERKELDIGEHDERQQILDDRHREYRGLQHSYDKLVAKVNRYFAIKAHRELMAAQRLTIEEAEENYRVHFMVGWYGSLVQFNAEHAERVHRVYLVDLWQSDIDRMVDEKEADRKETQKRISERREKKKKEQEKCMAVDLLQCW